MESDLSQPAAIASSGFKAMIQVISRPPFRRVSSDANHEMRGGDVRATTTCCRGNTASRNAHAMRKLAKFSARRQRESLCAGIEGTRMIVMLFHRSRLGKRNS